MKQTIALKFTIDSGDVDFYKEEVLEVKMQNIRDFRLLENQSLPPILHNIGNSWYVFTMNIIEKYKDTRTRIDQLIDEQDEMTVYYQYRYNSSDTMSVILNPNEIIKMYHFGELAAEVLHRLVFLQSSN